MCRLGLLKLNRFIIIRNTQYRFGRSIINFITSMNAWEQLKEQDAQNGNKYETIQHGKHIKGIIDGNEILEEIETSQTEDKLHMIQPVVQNLDRNNMHDSPVKLTKALVLLGYSSWSQLEPGIQIFLFANCNRSRK